MQTLKPGLPVSGFVFYPAGTYTGVRRVLADTTTNFVKEIAGPMIPKP